MTADILKIADRVLECDRRRNQEILRNDAYYENLYAIANGAPSLAEAVKAQAAEIERLIELLRPMANAKSKRLNENDCLAAARAVESFDAGRASEEGREDKT